MIEFTAFISSISALIKIAKGLQSVRDQHQISQATSELLERILSVQGDALSLQEQHFSLIHEKEKIEKKLSEFEDWKNTQSQYSLFRTLYGKVVYVPNESHKSSEPKHWLCANCFNERKKSILQPQNDGNNFTFFCPKCKTRLFVDSDEFAQYTSMAN